MKISYIVSSLVIANTSKVKPYKNILTFNNIPRGYRCCCRCNYYFFIKKTFAFIVIPFNPYLCVYTFIYKHILFVAKLKERDRNELLKSETLSLFYFHSSEYTGQMTRWSVGAGAGGFKGFCVPSSQLPFVQDHKLWGHIKNMWVCFQITVMPK